MTDIETQTLQKLAGECITHVFHREVLGNRDWCLRCGLSYSGAMRSRPWRLGCGCVEGKCSDYIYWWEHDD